MAVRNNSRDSWMTLVFAYGFRMTNGQEVWLDKERLPIHRMPNGLTGNKVPSTDSRGVTRDVWEPHKGMRSLFPNGTVFIGTDFKRAHEVQNLRHSCGGGFPHSFLVNLAHREREARWSRA